MKFHGILFPSPRFALRREAPTCFPDLQLDRIVDVIASSRPQYDLAPFFHTAPLDAGTIAYRQEVMRELARPEMNHAVRDFAERLGTMRRQRALADRPHHIHEARRWFLASAESYCDALETLMQGFDACPPASAGLAGFHAHLRDHLGSPAYRELAADVKQLLADLSGVHYSIQITEDKLTVRPLGEEADFGLQVAQCFGKFAEDEPGRQAGRFDQPEAMNPLEARILDAVARLFPEVFASLDRFCRVHAGYLEPRIAAFEREVQFYLAYLEFMEGFASAGLPFCYPQLSNTDKHEACCGTFDAALALGLLAEGREVVTNDYRLDGSERLMVVTGVNRGGKTAFARLFGQLHYLASLGCPVPGTSARLFLCDHVFAHFERAQPLGGAQGALETELLRLRDMLARATPASVIVINEMFSEAPLEDALYLGRRVMARLSAFDLLGVYVTFLDELATFDDKTVSLVSQVDPEDPAVRTFKLARGPAAGLAHAMGLAERSGLTYGRLMERIGQ